MSAVAHPRAGPLWSGGPRSSRAAKIAMLVELGVGLVISLVVLFAMVFASSRMAWDGPFVSAGRPTPFTAMLGFTAMVVIAQGASALLFARRSAWPRGLGIVIAFGFAGVCAFFIGAIVFEFAAGLITGRTPSMGDQYDQIGVFASLLPAALVFVLNARAVYFAVREFGSPRQDP
jgi:FtsH-binding integral membrane protein